MRAAAGMEVETGFRGLRLRFRASLLLYQHTELFPSKPSPHKGNTA